MPVGDPPEVRWNDFRVGASLRGCGDALRGAGTAAGGLTGGDAPIMITDQVTLGAR